MIKIEYWFNINQRKKMCRVTARRLSVYNIAWGFHDYSTKQNKKFPINSMFSTLGAKGSYSSKFAQIQGPQKKIKLKLN
jgi:hypothetical protein